VLFFFVYIRPRVEDLGLLGGSFVANETRSLDVASLSKGTFSPFAAPEVFGSVQKPAAAVAGPTPSPEAQEPPPEPGMDTTDVQAAFVVLLTLKKGQDVGLGFDFADDKLVRVCHVFAKGPISEYNAACSPEKRVMVGDFIVGVSSTSAVATTAQDMLRLLQNHGELWLSVSRPYEFAVRTLDKKDSLMGLDLGYHPCGSCAVVRQVLPQGAMSKYNAVAPRDKQVFAGDYIVSVNGRSGAANVLVQELAEAPALDLQVCRPAAPSPIHGHP